MAEKDAKDKIPKRPRHTQLVVPGSGKKKGRYKAVEKDRLGRSTPAEATRPVAEGAESGAPMPATPPQRPGAAPAANGPKPGKAEKPAGPAPKGGEHPAAEKPAGEAGPASAAGPARKTAKLIKLPDQKKRPAKKKLSPVKRKRRRRRIQALAVLAVAAVILMVYASGAYLTWGALIGDTWEGLLLSARPGDGFPTAFAMNGFLKAEPMGTGGFAVLGEREVALVSDTGRELGKRVQHNYVQPGLSAGNTRVVVYSRGGREYIVQGRSKTILRGDTEMDIQFCELSPGGWLLVASASRHSAEAQVYGPTGDWQFTWPAEDGDKPVMASFNKDNKNLVLGCVSAKNGALGSTIHVLRIDKDTAVAKIRADGALLIELHYLDNGRILAVYDSFTALFNQQGEELARYEYGQRRLANADVWDGKVALLFGAASQDTLHTVLLDNDLGQLFDVSAEALSGTSPRVLADKGGAFLLQGQQVTAYDLTGAAVGSYQSEEKTLTLTHGGQPLLLCSATVVPLESLLHGAAPDADPAASDLSRLVESSGVLDSAASPGSAGVSPPDSAADSASASTSAGDAGSGANSAGSEGGETSETDNPGEGDP